MQRPTSVSVASWIWLGCALLGTVAVSNILLASEFIAVFVGAGGTEEELAASQVIGVVGVIGAVIAMAAVAIQVVAAVELRDGARWARVLLTISASMALVGALVDLTDWSAWVLVAANVVALVLAYGESASAYLEAQRRGAASVPVAGAGSVPGSGSTTTTRRQHA